LKSYSVVTGKQMQDYERKLVNIP